MKDARVSAAFGSRRATACYGGKQLALAAGNINNKEKGTHSKFNPYNLGGLTSGHSQ
jgi:hypothetical protein